jgi:hypothetical protein
MGEWKLMAAGGRGSKGKGGQLFNLAKDIGEKKNVAADHPEIVKKLTAVLDQFKAEMKSEGRPPGRL